MKFEKLGFFFLSLAAIFELSHSAIVAYLCAHLNTPQYSSMYEQCANHLTHWAVWLGLFGLVCLVKAHYDSKSKGN